MVLILSWDCCEAAAALGMVDFEEVLFIVIRKGVFGIKKDVVGGKMLFSY